MIHSPAIEFMCPVTKFQGLITKQIHATSSSVTVTSGSKVVHDSNPSFGFLSARNNVLFHLSIENIIPLVFLFSSVAYVVFPEPVFPTIRCIISFLLNVTS